MDKYDASNDRYCYSGSTVLKNKLNIHDAEELETAEREITVFALSNIQYSPPPYTLDNFKSLHFALFSELYEWAGEQRDVDIAKGGTRFCTCSRIEAEALKLFTSLHNNDWLNGLTRPNFCEKLAEFYCEFNMIHPFREGNGRVQRLFFEHLALNAGYTLDWNDIDPQEWINANIDGVAVNYDPMATIFHRIVN